MDRRLWTPLLRPPFVFAIGATAIAVLAAVSSHRRKNISPPATVTEDISRATRRIASLHRLDDARQTPPDPDAIRVFDGASVSLVDADHELVLAMTPFPTGTWHLGGLHYALHDAVLTSQFEVHDANSLRAQYRLHFSIDVCEHEQPIAQIRSVWPWPCMYEVGRPRPVLFRPFALLIERTYSRSPATPLYGATYLDMLEAACVPTSGLGPSCQLRGSRAQRSDGTRTVNGRL